MFLLRAIHRTQPQVLKRASIRSLGHLRSVQASQKSLSAQRWTFRTHRRCSSSDAVPARKPINAYPARINIYHAGVFSTVTIGFTRIATVVLAGLGCFAFVPGIYFNPDASNLWIPAVFVGAFVPLTVMLLATASAVHTIHVDLPGWARRSKDALQSFVRNVPLDTELKVSAMRWYPWPIHETVQMSELRRIPQSWIWIANLERTPRQNEGEKVNGFMAKLVRNTQRTFYIDPAKGGKKSQVTGVWEKIWDQIPRTDDVKPAREPTEPVRMANRPPRTKRPVALPPKITAVERRRR